MSTAGDVFRAHMLCCFIEDPIGVSLLDHFNLDHVMWESDFPHSDSSWPRAPESLASQLAGIDPIVVDQITHLNAMAHFDFDPFAIRPRKDCTAQALRAEAGDVDTTTHVGRPPDESDREFFRELSTRALRGRK